MHTAWQLIPVNEYDYIMCSLVACTFPMLYILQMIYCITFSGAQQTYVNSVEYCTFFNVVYVCTMSVQQTRFSFVCGRHWNVSKLGCLPCWVRLWWCFKKLWWIYRNLVILLVNLTLQWFHVWCQRYSPLLRIHTQGVSFKGCGVLMYVMSGLLLYYIKYLKAQIKSKYLCQVY